MTVDPSNADPATGQGSSCAAGWIPECPADELMIAFFRVKRGMQANSAGVDPGMFPVLHELAVHGAQRQGRIAQSVGLDASTTSRHVRTLLSAGMITAQRDATDGRATLLAIADPGVQYLREHMQAKRAALQAATESFTDSERNQLISLLSRFAEALESLDRPVGGGRTPSIDLRLAAHPATKGSDQ